MPRYDTRLEDGTLYLEAAEDRLEVGSMTDVVDVLGETYTLEYGEKQRKVGWLDTDEDGTITFDVRETILDLDFDSTFAEKVAVEPLDQTDEDGVPLRTATFAALLRDIWDSKGTVELE